MAASRVLSRLTLRSSSPSLPFKLNQKPISSPSISPTKMGSKPSSVSEPIKRISRLPLVLSSLESMMPLHSAIASARLKSILAAESQSWGLIPQGISMPL